MADLGLNTIEGQDNTALGLCEGMELGGIAQREGHELFIPCDEMVHRARCDDNTTVHQLLVNVGNTAVLGIA